MKTKSHLTSLCHHVFRPLGFAASRAKAPPSHQGACRRIPSPSPGKGLKPRAEWLATVSLGRNSSIVLGLKPGLKPKAKKERATNTAGSARFPHEKSLSQ